MEPTRLAIAAVAFGLAGAAFFLRGPVESPITVTQAMLTPMGAGYALTATISNTGAPDVLTGVGSDQAGRVLLIGGGGIGAFAIPAGSTPSLAGDGAHAMLLEVEGASDEGRIIPVTLTFENAGDVTARARVAGGMAMDHGARFAVPEGEPRPAVTLQVARADDGWAIRAETTEFSFSRDAVDGPHQPGIGHGHLYLNGLKLQRLYGPEASIGPLPPGTHTVSVTLNTNDHRAYEVGGQVVTATAEIVAD